jgi:hypothetical protein
MATTQQIEANRLNAQKSTGPRSVEGKAVSCLNATKTGLDAKSQIIRGEDPATLQTLTADYQERWQPATPEQRLLVDTLIDCDWLLRRFRKSETQLWYCTMQELKVWKPKPKGLLGKTFSRGSDEFSRLQRRIDSTSRNYHRALKELQRLDSPRPQPEPTPAPRERSEPAPRPSETKLRNEPNSGVPSPADAAPAPPPPPAPFPHPFTPPPRPLSVQS